MKKLMATFVMCGLISCSSSESKNGPIYDLLNGDMEFPDNYEEILMKDYVEDSLFNIHAKSILFERDSILTDSLQCELYFIKDDNHNQIEIIYTGVHEALLNSSCEEFLKCISLQELNKIDSTCTRLSICVFTDDNISMKILSYDGIRTSFTCPFNIQRPK